MQEKGIRVKKKPINRSLKGSRNELSVKKFYEALGFVTIFRRVRSLGSQDLANLFDLAFVGKATNGFTYNKLVDADPFYIAAFREALAKGYKIQLFVSSKTNISINDKDIKAHLGDIKAYKEAYQLRGQYFILSVCYNSRMAGRGKERHREPARIEHWLV